MCAVLYAYDYIRESTGIDVQPYKGVLKSMSEMHKWYEKYMGSNFDTVEMRKLLIDATFVQAEKDGVKLIEIGEDVWGLNTYFNGDINNLVESFKTSKAKYGEGIELRLQIGLSRHCSINDLEEWLEPFWNEEIFHSIDLYGDELAQPIETFIPIYKKAKSCGLRLKAHVGEWGSAEDIREAVEVLELDEVQHGISAINSKEVMRYLESNKIRLNITPTSNLKLGRVKSLKEHPIKTFFHSGIDVTINSDDILIFDSAVSKEYLRLYQSETLSANELNDIRLNGLREIC